MINDSNKKRADFILKTFDTFRGCWCVGKPKSMCLKTLDWSVSGPRLAKSTVMDCLRLVDGASSHGQRLAGS